MRYSAQAASTGIPDFRRSSTFDTQAVQIGLALADSTELQAAFEAEAKKYNVYPLDSSAAERLNPAIRPSLTRGRSEFTSAATIVNQKTGNLKLVQKLLGHSNLSTTADVYTHTSAAADRTFDMSDLIKSSERRRRQHAAR